MREGRGHKFPLSGRGGNVTTAKPLWTDVTRVGTRARSLRVGRQPGFAGPAVVVGVAAGASLAEVTGAAGAPG